MDRITFDILRKVYKTKLITFEQAKPFEVQLGALNKLEYMQPVYKDGECIGQQLSSKGRAYYEQCQSEKLRFFLPVFISALSLLVAVTALVLSVLI